MRLQPILDQVVETAARLGRSDGCFIHLVDDSGLLHLRASFGGSPEAIEYERLHPDRPGPGSLIGRVAMTRKPVHIPDVDADSDYTFPAQELYRTLLGLPVLVEDKLVGVFGLSRQDVRPFGDGEIELMATFADQSAIAIANAELFETVERQKAELARFLSPEVAALVSRTRASSSLPATAPISPSPTSTSAGSRPLPRRPSQRSSSRSFASTTRRRATSSAPTAGRSSTSRATG